MLTDKQIKSLPTKEMIRCEVTGKLIPIDEAEVIIIKIIKSKEADIGGFNPFNKQMIGPSPYEKKADPIVLDDDHVMLDRGPKRKSIIPPAILATMQLPDTPGAATENRRV